MGRMLTRAPRRVCKHCEHMLGYLKSTFDMALHYGGCDCDHGEDSELAFPRSMLSLEVRSDASFGPAGGRGHQGLIAMDGGCPIQWEWTQQAFGTLATLESELLGYTDVMVMGESVSAVIDIPDGNQLYKVLCMGTTNPVSDFLRAQMDPGEPVTCVCEDEVGA